MTNTFEVEKNREAFIYTAIVVIIILLIAILIEWPLPPPPAPVAQDLVEINLGNFDEGMGEVQPLIKGEKAPDLNPPEDNKQEAAASNNEPQAQQPIEDSKDEDAAPIDKPDKIVKTTTPPKNPTTQPVKTVTQPAVVPAPKPRVPKIPGYQGNKGGTGNGATEDNGYKYQGNKTGTGDKGDPSGNPDSYGNNKGGKIGAPKVEGNRTVIDYRSYNFTDDLGKATIYAKVKVSPDGKGKFTGFAKRSTQTTQPYANAIIRYLQNIKFNPADYESDVVVQFNFNVN
jgi:outer membrane biosynthesis protein TonB